MTEIKGANSLQGTHGCELYRQTNRDQVWPGICEASGNLLDWTRFVCRKTELSTCSFRGAFPAPSEQSLGEISREHQNKTEPSICVLHRKHLQDRQTRCCPCLVQTIPPLNPSALVLHDKHRAFPVTQMPGNLLPAGGASVLTVAHGFLSSADRCVGSLSKGPQAFQSGPVLNRL